LAKNQNIDKNKNIGTKSQFWQKNQNFGKTIKKFAKQKIKFLGKK